MNTKRIPRMIGAAAMFAAAMMLSACDSGLGSSVAETESGEIRLTSQRRSVTSETVSTGVFTASGSFIDYGDYEEVVEAGGAVSTMSSVHGRKTFVGNQGVVTVEYYASIEPAFPGRVRATGSWGVVGGSGEYTGIEARGSINIEVSATADASEVTRLLVGEIEQ